MLIKVIGTWCPKCKLLSKTVEDAAKKLNIDYEIVKIDDAAEIAEYDIMELPALIIDDVLVEWFSEPDEMLDILQEIQNHPGGCCCGDHCEHDHGDDDECSCGWCNH